MLNWMFKSAATFVLALSASASVAAPIANGGFETGTFAGWTNFGNYTSIVDSNFGVAPATGNYAALLVGFSSARFFDIHQQCDYSEADVFSDRWAERCPVWPPIPFPNAPKGGPQLAHAFPGPIEIDGAGFVPFRTEATMGQDFIANAGNRLTLDWTWLSSDIGCPSRGGDDAFVFVTNGASLIGFEAFQVPCQGNTAPESTGFNYAADLGSISISIPTSGIWTLYISVGNGFEDTLYASGLLVDNVRLEVPEPSSLAALLIGLVGFTLTRRGKQ